MLYTVGEAAEIMGVAASTLRYYDKEGLLPFVERSGGGIRVFKEKDFEWLKTIECLKSTKMSIREIKQFIDWCIEGDSTIEKRLALIERQREKVEAEIKKAEDTLEMLDYKRWYYETAKAAGTCAVHAAMKDEDVPERFRARRNAKHGGFVPNGR